MLSEWSCRRLRIGLTASCGGRRLSAEPLSYRYFVATTVTTTPVQSAIAFPKKDPRCVLGLRRYRAQSTRRARLSRPHSANGGGENSGVEAFRTLLPAAAG